MADATTILRLLRDRAPVPVSIDELVPHLPKTKERALGIQAIGTLVNNKLAQRHAVLKPAHYIATAKGIALIDAGKAVTSGANGPRTGVSKPRKDSFRVRMWRALRIKQTATIDELVELAIRQGESWESCQDNTRKYLSALIRGGIVVMMALKQKGATPLSNGKNRYRLIKDLGPEAPVPCKAFVYDPNAKLISPPRPERLPYLGDVKAPAEAKSEAA